MFEPVFQPVPSLGLSLSYLDSPADTEPAADVLMEIHFGGDAHFVAHPQRVQVSLMPLHGVGTREVWRGRGKVHCGRQGLVRYSEDDDYLFGVIEIDESAHADIAAVAATAYAQLSAFQAASGKPHLLRIWNYFDAITAGVGDAERYKLFCAGRADGLGAQPLRSLPAATAIGRRDGSPRLQVYWLAAKASGQAIENPRQISAYHYPRQYGRVAPKFARATLNAAGELLISGTASVVGHATHHDGDLRAQLAETLLNIDTLLAQAHARDARCPPAFTESTLLKVYLRHADMCATVVAELQSKLPHGVSILVLEADICRSDLLIEIDGLQR